MEKKLSLNGKWTLYFREELKNKSYTIPTHAVEHIEATVPGDALLDLSRAGILPKDIFKGMGTEIATKYESYGFWYNTTFDKPQIRKNEKIILQFEAVDCCAEYYLNGELISKSNNAFIPHEIDITNIIKEKSNSLFVHILPALKQELESPYAAHLLYGYKLGGGNTLRKPIHSFGWDILPRCVNASIWRNVNLVLRDDFNFENIYYHVTLDKNKTPTLTFFVSVNSSAKELFGDGLTVTVKGKCENRSNFYGETVLKKVKGAKFVCQIENPLLWWPYGYGEPNIYDTEVTLLKNGKIIDQKQLNVGLRTIELDRTNVIDENPRFHFIVNDEEIFCRGSNWVPMDAFHSRDKEKYPKALVLATEIGCNMLRVWGGGVYEGESFYDYCDRNGILIWQDFMMACQFTPYTEDYLKNLESEFTHIIKSLRNHPSIALWSGDNEIDEAFSFMGINPEFNLITRNLLPRLVFENDAYRAYLPSSPYLCGEHSKKYAKGEDIFPERHLWGSRDYFKADFYRNSKAVFVSETGYHGCPCEETIRKTVDDEYVWPCFNEQWILHSSDQNGNDARVRLMDNQIRQLFGINVNNLNDFIFASQISQAEAKKFFIERMRVHRPYSSGILWWNLIDGWPQMSDAIVDYFHHKKIAFSYIKHSQSPFALMIDEMENWHYTLVAANDTLENINFSYEIRDIETNEILANGKYTAKANSSDKIAPINLFYSDQKMLLIKWVIDGVEYHNHYLCGMPPFSLKKYKNWYKKLAEVYDDNIRI